MSRWVVVMVVSWDVAAAALLRYNGPHLRHRNKPTSTWIIACLLNGVVLHDHVIGTAWNIWVDSYRTDIGAGEELVSGYGAIWFVPSWAHDRNATFVTAVLHAAVICEHILC